MLINRASYFRHLLFSILVIISISVSAFAQSSGGQFTIEHSVIANSGGTSAGGAFTVAGTNAQSIAGTKSTQSQFGLHGGFWNPVEFGSNVSVSGTVYTLNGGRLRNAVVVITDAQNVQRTVITNAFGYYQFDNVVVGGVYTIIVISKHYKFLSQTVLVSDALASVDFVADE